MTSTAVIVMGVAGSGKTTVAVDLSERLGWQYAEADDFHSVANKAKMAAGHPLTDEDREPWLEAIRDWITVQRTDVVVTCSALKRSYRETLGGADARVRFLLLDGPRALLEERIGHREGHFMPASMLDSQLDTLEPLQPDEDGVVVSIAATPDEITAAAVDALGLVC